MQNLLKIIAKLRSPKGGCPWDRQQTHQSLKQYLLEETYELLSAIDEKDSEHICEELGDLLLQIVLHAQIASEKNQFDFQSVVDSISRKMILRHPHVFTSKRKTTVKQVLNNWEKIKRTEQKASIHQSILHDIPSAFPALYRAEKIQRRVSTVGFDWPDSQTVLNKVDEELIELKVELNKKRKNLLFIQEEIGDLLFTIVNLSRKLGLNAEDSLRMANRKFEKRFTQVEKLALKDKRKMSEMSLKELDKLWKTVKRKKT